MIALPIDASLPEITAALRGHPSLVLVAAPGAGKTTRVPPALIKAGILAKDHPHLIMLQPRRVAARAAAARIADEQSWQLGQEVGYHIRFEKRYGPQTRIRILTEAILTRMLLADPALEGVGCVILDEFHERNLHTDLALAFLREVQQTIRPDLKILVMSATLDAQPVATFLGHCPIIETQGRTFPIEISYRPPRDTRLEDHIAHIVDDLINPASGLKTQDSGPTGDLLIFLPGKAEIDRTARALSPTGNGQSPIGNALILPLHGSLTSEEQQRALVPDPQGRRKIILATNIAETSLTIEGVRNVIDSGLARVASFDADRGMDRLDLERISKASATQRAGRAGRQPPPPPARAIRLWPESEQKHRAEFNAPEIQRVDLAGTILAVHAWGAHNPRQFGWFEAPPEEMLAAAEELLSLLGALADGKLTDIGRQMLAIPAHPRIARLLLAAAGTPLLNGALSLAALLADDSRGRQPIDPLSTLHRLPEHLGRIRDQFAQIANRLRPQQGHSSNAQSLTDLLLLAYPDRLARRRGSDPHAALLIGGSGARLAPESLTPALAHASLFLALDAHHDPRNRKAEALVRTAVPIEQAALERLFPQRFHTETALEYDQQKQKVIAFSREYFADLLLHEDPHGKVDPAKAGDVLAAALAPRAVELFTKNEPAARLLARTALLRHYMPEHPWPPFDELQLQALLKEAAAHKRTLAELTEGHGLADALRAALAYPLDRLLDQHAPETLEVPTGNRMKLEYALPANPLNNQKSEPNNPAASPPPPPILAVRLQELFGLLDTPRVAAGRVPVVLHLLSPGFKPMQITSDLASFWKSAYFEVRKDLRARYPKHKWPEDPLTAKPEAKGRRR